MIGLAINQPSDGVVVSIVTIPAAIDDGDGWKSKKGVLRM